jgi:hypothetical protein
VTKWEYLQVIPSYRKNTLRPTWVNGQMLPNWTSGPEFFDYLRQLGDQGWELVTVTKVSDHPGIYYFKRPKSE